MIGAGRESEAPAEPPRSATESVPPGPPSGGASVGRPVAMLIGLSAALWVLVAVPARHLAGEWAVAYSATAAGICLVPAVLTLAWARWSARESPESFALIVLAGSGIRLVVVALAMLVLQSSVPFFGDHPGFGVWLLGFYLATLALEMALVLSGGPGSHK